MGNTDAGSGTAAVLARWDRELPQETLNTWKGRKRHNLLLGLALILQEHPDAWDEVFLVTVRAELSRSRTYDCPGQFDPLHSTGRGSGGDSIVFGQRFSGRGNSFRE